MVCMYSIAAIKGAAKTELILMNDEDIESILCGHSEKLAIAFNFIQKPRPTTIQITKNLRICRDCR